VFTLESYQENRLIKFGILTFWFSYWLFNVASRVTGDSPVLFSLSDSSFLIKTFISLKIILEVFALLFVAVALFYFVLKRRIKARSAFLCMTFISIIAVTFFMAGDQIFGSGKGVLAYTTYLGVILISWFLYKKSDEE